MVMPISQLQSCEFALYPNRLGLNANCPSYVNGYRANLVPNYGYNSYLNAVPDATRVSNYNSIYENNAGGKINYTNPSFASSTDIETLAQYYSKNSAPSESFVAAAVGGGAFTLITNLRLLAHPWNSFSTIGKVENMFKGVKDSTSNLYKLWKNPDTHKIMTDAYARMHKLEGGAKWRLGLFKSKLDPSEVTRLRDAMDAALKSGKPEEIAKITEEIRVATNYKNGYIPQGWAKVKHWFGYGDGNLQTLTEKLASEKTTISAAGSAEKLAEKANMSIGKHFKKGLKGQGLFGGLLMMGMEVWADWDKLKAAFSSNDSSAGIKQATQTAVKGAGSFLGWTAGEAIGTWAGAKLGAIAGTAIAPGVGTVIGAVAGMVGGSVGCWLAGKLSHWIVGKDVGEEIQLANLKKSPEGHMQLLQQTMEMAQNDKKIDPRTIQAMQNVYNTYASA